MKIAVVSRSIPSSCIKAVWPRVFLHPMPSRTWLHRGGEPSCAPDVLMPAMRAMVTNGGTFGCYVESPTCGPTQSPASRGLLRSSVNGRSWRYLRIPPRPAFWHIARVRRGDRSRSLRPNAPFPPRDRERFGSKSSTGGCIYPRRLPGGLRRPARRARDALLTRALLLSRRPAHRPQKSARWRPRNRPWPAASPEESARALPRLVQKLNFTPTNGPYSHCW